MQKDSVVKLTQKQGYWLKQIKLAKASGQSFGVYAKANNLNPHQLYQYQHTLRKKGVFKETIKPPVFDRVKQRGLPVNNPSRTEMLSVYFPNGLRLDFPASLNADVMTTFIDQISRCDVAS